MESHGPHLFPSGGEAHEEGLPDAPSDGQAFPGVDRAAMGCPPRMNKPHVRTLLDSTDVKWCSACGKWTDRFCAGHTPGQEAPEGANLAE